MLPIPNPYVPEEHEPWCPLSGGLKLLVALFENCRVDQYWRRLVSEIIHKYLFCKYNNNNNNKLILV